MFVFWVFNVFSVCFNGRYYDIVGIVCIGWVNYFIFVFEYEFNRVCFVKVVIIFGECGMYGWGSLVFIVGYGFDDDCYVVGVIVFIVDFVIVFCIVINGFFDCVFDYVFRYRLVFGFFYG